MDIRPVKGTDVSEADIHAIERKRTDEIQTHLDFFATIPNPDLQLVDFAIGGYHDESSVDDLMSRWAPELWDETQTRANVHARLHRKHAELKKRKKSTKSSLKRPKWHKRHEHEWKQVKFRKHKKSYESLYVKNKFFK